MGNTRLGDSPPSSFLRFHAVPMRSASCNPHTQVVVQSRQHASGMDEHRGLEPRFKKYALEALGFGNKPKGILTRIRRVGCRARLDARPLMVGQ